MKTQNKATVIGAFVMGGLALLIAGIIFFGKTNFFEHRTEYVMYFAGSVDGLRVGAPVDFRGVRIGQVTSIKLMLDVDSFAAHIPVYITLNPDDIKQVGEYKGKGPMMENLINKGLRAQLVKQSVLTGLMRVELAFHPGSPAHYYHRTNHYVEIPTLQSNFDKITESASDIVTRISKLPLEQFVNSYISLADSLNKVVTSTELKQTMIHLNASLKTLDQTLQGVSPLAYQMNQSMVDFSNASHSVEVLSNYLEQHPESIVWGKPKQGNAP